MTILRRFLVMMALLFWQGGFLFYASVVVPIAQHEIGHLSQGFITRRVTNHLNLSGVIALGLVAMDLMVFDPKLWRRIARAILWLGMAISLAWLAWLHTDLDALIRTDPPGVVDYSAFRAGHRTYLWISTVQWGLALVYLWLTMAAWRAADVRGIPEKSA